MNLLEEIRTKYQPDIEDVERIDLQIGPVASTAASLKEPVKGVEGKFSVWFLAAVALAEGNISVDTFTDAKVNDPRLVALRKKIHTSLDPRIKFGARLSLKMKDGTEYNEFLAEPKGDPANPLSFDELVSKYEKAAILAVPKKNISLLIEKIKGLDQLADISEIVDLSHG